MSEQAKRWDDRLWKTANSRSGTNAEVANAMTCYAARFFVGAKFGWTDYRTQMFDEADERLKKAINK